MDPKYGHDESLTAGADLMVSPDLGGELLPAEKAEEEKAATPEVEAAEPEQETEPEDQHEDPEEEPEPLAAEAPDDGEDDVEDSEEPDAKSGARRYKVKVDGVDTEVSLDELKQGFSGQQYVQKGMQEAAAVKKEAEAVYNSLQNERRQIAAFAQQVQQGLRPPPVEPDKALYQTDPLAYMDLKIKFDEEAAQYNQQMQHLNQVAGQQSEADRQAMAVYIQGELTQLQAIDPEFRTAESAGKLREKMLTKGHEVYGYSPEEIGQIVDHRAIRVLRDAIRYQEIVAGKDKAQVDVKSKVVKGGTKKRVSTKTSRRRKQKDQLKKSGSLTDALDLMFQ